MRRRILVALVGLTAAILVGAVVPLGLKASAHDYAAFVADTISRTRAATAAAEELLADNLRGPELNADLAAAARQGDSAVVLLANGTVIRRAGRPFPVPRGMISRAESTANLVSAVRGDQVLVVAPVRSNGVTVGVTVLMRPTGQLEYSLRAFWLMLILIAAMALAAAVVLGLALSRWVALPLARLGASARRLGDGDLAARALADGPVEVRELSATFNAMAGRLETLVHGHRAMVADVSHQLRTPLAALRLQLEGLAGGTASPSAEVSAALTEVARLGRMVDGLLAVARAENATPDIILVSVSDVVAERTAAWAPVAEEQEVRLLSVIPLPVRVALGNGYLEQILDNLIANAIEATTAGNTVTVTATPNVRGARVVVADDGPGMSQADMDRAFLRFASTSLGGSGLGLAIVYRLASAGGGRATLGPTPGGGLTVTVDLGGPMRDGPDPGSSTGETGPFTRVRAGLSLQGEALLSWRRRGNRQTEHSDIPECEVGEPAGDG
jgi:signal transduction histidine kinase